MIHYLKLPPAILFSLALLSLPILATSSQTTGILIILLMQHLRTKLLHETHEHGASGCEVANECMIAKSRIATFVGNQSMCLKV